MMRVRHDHEGAAAVEFALLLPLLIVIAFGIIELSNAYNRQQGMQAAVREGARLASTSSDTSQVSAADVEDRIETALMNFDDGGAGFPATGGSGDLAQVRGDVVVTVTSTPAAGSHVCDGADQVQVVAEIRSDDGGVRRDAYGINLPLVGQFALPLRAEAVFPCIG